MCSQIGWKGWKPKQFKPVSAAVFDYSQAYLEYSDEEWDPPSAGMKFPACYFDYNVNGQWRHAEHDDGDEYDISGCSGTVGANLGAWAFCARGLADYRHENDSEYKTARQFRTELGLEPAITLAGGPRLSAAQLTLGEGSLESNPDIFDGF